MQQLSGLDAAFLAIDTPTSTGHVGAIHVLQARPQAGQPPLTLDRLTQILGERLHLVPSLRRRIVEVPFGLDQPYWVEDPHFDLEFHVRELALPAPGSTRQLTEQVARVHARPLDRSRPLWEIYLIQGLAGDRLALYAKVHHAMIDGVAGQELTAALLDPSPEGRRLPPAPPWTPDPLPGSVSLLTRAVASLAARPQRALRVTADVVRSAPGLLSTVVAPRLPFVDRLVAHPDVLFRAPVRAPATPFNRSVSPHRRVALRTVPFDVVRAVKAASGMTVNDVVLAMCAGALRRWLLAHDALPDGPLVAALPVSVRTGQGAVKGGNGSLGNRVSLMTSVLPTNVEDPLDRLAIVHAATKRAKEEHQALPANVISDLYGLAMPTLVGLATRANAQLRLLERIAPFNLFVSNVPGPSIPLFVGGAEVIASYPVSAITDGQGLNITVVSYLGGMHFGLVADRDLVPDLDDLAAYLEDELEELARRTGHPESAEQAARQAEEPVPLGPLSDAAPAPAARRPSRSSFRAAPAPVAPPRAVRTTAAKRAAANRAAAARAAATTKTQTPSDE
jgi:diacylglycerol O-acyltransferase